VTVDVPTAGLTFAIRVQRFLNEPLGTYAYASLDLLRSIAPSRTDIVNTALVPLPPGSKPQTDARRSRRPTGVTAVSDSRTLLDSFNKLLGFFYAIVAIMLICGAALAFALLCSRSPPAPPSGPPSSRPCAPPARSTARSPA
jgi:putative ABC transport system permease protein